MQNPNPPLEPSRPPLPPDEQAPHRVPHDLGEVTPEHPGYGAVPPFDDILTPDDPPGHDDTGE